MVSIIQADARSIPLADKSVHCCVTSPPYWGLRDYGVVGQLGLERTPEEYIAQMVQVFREVKRVLRDDGVMFLNMGDSYSGNRGNTPEKPGLDNKYKNANLAIGHRKLVGGGGRREGACGISGKELADSQGRGCLCESLCDACRVAYQLGKAHSGFQPGPMPVSFASESTRESRESLLGHLPTLDSTGPGVHNASANSHRQITASRESAQPLGVRASSKRESFSPLSECNSAVSSPGEVCQLCGRSLHDSAPACVRKASCSCGNGVPGSLDRILRRDASGTAWLNISQLKAKDLVGIPFLLAFALRADGWYLRSDIIWAKPNPMPESVTDRPTKAHEYIFMLSKSERYYYDQEAILEPVSENTHMRLSQNLALQIGSHRANGGGKTNGPMKAVGRKAKQDETGNRHYTGFNERWKVKHNASFDAFVCLPVTERNKRSVWTVNAQGFAEAHFATFPEELIKPCILAGCPPGGIVFDPFIGSGTTALVARNLQCDAVGLELNPAYIEIAKRRLAQEVLEFR